MPADKSARPADAAEIAAEPPKRLHPLTVFADYRKAAKIDGFAALAVTAATDTTEVSASSDGDKNVNLPIAI